MAVWWMWVKRHRQRMQTTAFRVISTQIALFPPFCYPPLCGFCKWQIPRVSLISAEPLFFPVIDFSLKWNKVCENTSGRTQMCFFLSPGQFLVLSKLLSWFCRLHALFLITASFLFLGPLLCYLVTFTLTFKQTVNLQNITEVMSEPGAKGHIGSNVGNMASTQN